MLSQADMHLREIIEGRAYYGRGPIQLKTLGYYPTVSGKYPVVLVGQVGVSQSVGQMIREVERRRKQRAAVSMPLTRYRFGHEYAYGVEIVDYPYEDSLKTVLLCTGCTDDSGEGNRARELMEAYFRALNWPIEDAYAGDLIELLLSLEQLRTRTGS